VLLGLLLAYAVGILSLRAYVLKRN
jgi:hypothetical protein